MNSSLFSIVSVCACTILLRHCIVPSLALSHFLPSCLCPVDGRPSRHFCSGAAACLFVTSLRAACITSGPPGGRMGRAVVWWRNGRLVLHLTRLSCSFHRGAFPGPSPAPLGRPLGQKGVRDGSFSGARLRRRAPSRTPLSPRGRPGGGIRVRKEEEELITMIINHHCKEVPERGPSWHDHYGSGVGTTMSNPSYFSPSRFKNHAPP